PFRDSWAANLCRCWAPGDLGRRTRASRPCPGPLSVRAGAVVSRAGVVSFARGARLAALLQTPVAPLVVVTSGMEEHERWRVQIDSPPRADHSASRTTR